MKKTFKVGFLQINPMPGDILGNQKQILQGYQSCIELGADLVLGVELGLIGYWPGDLLQDKALIQYQKSILEHLAQQIGAVPLLIGCVEIVEGVGHIDLYNAVAWCENGVIKTYGRKCLLPNYGVFDEKRHFKAGEKPLVYEFKGHKIGVTICEDIWTDPTWGRPDLYAVDPIKILKSAEVDLVLNLSASPWHRGHVEAREKTIQRVAKMLGVPVAYCNMVSGSEELLFDGRSMGVAASGEVLYQLPHFETAMSVWDVFLNEKSAKIPSLYQTEGIEDLYQALVFGLKDYAYKMGFQKALVGLSGGIDSSVVAAIAVKALGSEAVLGVALPSAISSKGSVFDAEALAHALNMPFKIIGIQETVEAAVKSLSQACELGDLTYQNIQARLRGLMLMGIANEGGQLLLTTGNKSEVAVGYCTLYGDMCGGLNILGDVYKTDVYHLAHVINQKSGFPVISEAVLTKAPSAELAPNQTDQDTLPPYATLDAILYCFLERRQSLTEVLTLGYDETIVRWIFHQLYKMEYKRYQAAPILRTSAVAFGVGRRVPIVSRIYSCLS